MHSGSRPVQVAGEQLRWGAKTIQLSQNNPNGHQRRLLGTSLSSSGPKLWASTLVDHLAIEDGYVDFCLLDGLGRNCEDVVGEHHQVCHLARLDRSLDRFLVFSEGGSHGVSMDSLRNADALLGDPSVWIFTVESAPRGRSIDAHHRIQWRDGPVGTKCERCGRIQQGCPCVARLDTLRTDDGFGPPAVVDGVEGLHGRDDAKLCEARVFLGMKMLHVLDAWAPIRGAIVFLQAGVKV